MRYLSMYGSDGFRTFRGILNGKLAYTPEKIAKIDPEILSEREYHLRLQEVVAPYTDNHPKLKDILPVISEKIGTLHEVNKHYAIWQPKNHLSLLGQHLIASMLDQIMPEELDNTLRFVADTYDSGLAFADAFSIEQKEIYVPNSLKDSLVLPEENDRTKIIPFDDDKNLSQSKALLKEQNIRFDSFNMMRIVGHMATIINALFETEKIRFRFYNDPVSLALPADDIEFLLAGYYIAQSDLPIKKIYAVSSDHRMIHNFLERGEFVFNGQLPRPSYLFSLYRMLFEASRASVEKIVRWKSELRSQGSFKIDSTTAKSIQQIFTPIFATKAVANIGEDESQISVPATRLNRAIYKIAAEGNEQILAFDLQNPTK